MSFHTNSALKSEAAIMINHYSLMMMSLYQKPLFPQKAGSLGARSAKLGLNHAQHSTFWVYQGKANTSKANYINWRSKRATFYFCKGTMIA